MMFGRLVQPVANPRTDVIETTAIRLATSRPDPMILGRGCLLTSQDIALWVLQ